MKSDVKISGKRLQITRVLNAPRPVVFSWWSSAEKLQQWSSCKECVHSEVVMDFRVGGGFTQKMTLDVQGKMCDFGMNATYQEIVEPEKIVYRADLGFATTLVTVSFLEQGKSTKVIVTHDGCPDEFFSENVSRGTGESFEKLDSLLAWQPVEQAR